MSDGFDQSAANGGPPIYRGPDEKIVEPPLFADSAAVPPEPPLQPPPEPPLQAPIAASPFTQQVPVVSTETPLEPSAVSSPDPFASEAGATSGGFSNVSRVGVSLGVLAVVVLALGAWALLGGSNESWMLVREDGSRPSFHLIGPGDEPNASNEVDFEFDQFYVRTGSSSNTAQPNNMKYLFGVGENDDESELVAIDLRSREVIPVLSRDDYYSVWTEGDTVLASASGSGRSSGINAADPRDPVDLGRASGWLLAPEGERVMRLQDGDLELVDPKNGDEIASLSGDSAVFSPDGSYFAAYEYGRSVAVYRSSDGQEVVAGRVDLLDDYCDDCLRWNRNNSVIVNGSEPELLTSSGEVVPFDGYTFAQFIRSDSDDLMLYDENYDSELYSAATGETARFNDSGYLIWAYPLSGEQSSTTPVFFVEDGRVSRFDEAGDLVELLDTDISSWDTYAWYDADSSYIVASGEEDFEVWRVSGGEASLLLDERGSLSDLGRTGDVLWARSNDRGADLLWVFDGDESTEIDSADSLSSPMIVGDSLYYTRNDRGRAEIARGNLNGDRPETAVEDFSILAASSP